MGFIEDEQAGYVLEYQEVCAALTRIATGAQESSLNDGQVDQKVKEVDYKELVKRKAFLSNAIAEYQGDTCNGRYTY